MEAIKQEAFQLKKQLEESQQLVVEKERLEAQHVRNLEEANKSAEAVLELRKELQNMKVGFSLSFYHFKKKFFDGVYHLAVIVPFPHPG